MFSELYRATAPKLSSEQKDIFLTTKALESRSNEVKEGI